MFRVLMQAAASGIRCFDDMCEIFVCDESESNSSVREGKSDCKRCRSRANLHAFCQGNIGHVVGGHGRSLQQEAHSVEERS